MDKWLRSWTNLLLVQNNWMPWPNKQPFILKDKHNSHNLNTTAISDQTFCQTRYCTNFCVDFVGQRNKTCILFQLSSWWPKGNSSIGNNVSASHTHTLTQSPTHFVFYFNNTISVTHGVILKILTFRTIDQSDMETWPDQQKYKYNDKWQRQKDKKDKKNWKWKTKRQRIKKTSFTAIQIDFEILTWHLISNNRLIRFSH